MAFLNTVNLVTSIFFSIIAVMYLHFTVFAVVGTFTKKKKAPVTDKFNRLGVIIPARNEESVVPGLIESVQKNNYPQDKLQIFVIAHNCSDRTAEIARSMGVTVYEYNNPEENTMGYAFRHLFSCIERDYGTQNFDGFLLFNADNVLDRNYIARMNDAFEFYDHESVITSFRNSKNFGSNLISGLYGMYFALECRLESRGRTMLGCSTRVQGTGYLINSSIVKDGWPYVTLAEDWEFSADQILRGNTIRYCDEAVFYDEQPTSFRIMWRQRVRWARGNLIVFITRGKDLIKKLFSRNNKHRVSTYDIMSNVLPLFIASMTVSVIQAIMLFIAPFVSSELTFSNVFIGDSTNVLTSQGALFIWLRSLVISYVVMLMTAVLVFIVERRRIKGVSLLNKVMISLMWPFFLIIQFPICVQALFSRNLVWKPIPHSDQTTFDHVNSTDRKDKK